MELLKITMNPAFGENDVFQEKKKKKTVLILIGIGIANIVLELLIRKLLGLKLADSLVEISHVFVYFMVPFLFNIKRICAIDYFFSQFLPQSVPFFT